MTRPDPQTLKNLLDGINQVAILIPKNPQFDAVASALALKLSLEQANKTVSVAAPDSVTVEFHRLVGAESITNSFGSRNLVITFPGQAEVVDKVTYNIEGGELQLVITPKNNTAGLDHKKVKFISGGTQAELVIFMGVNEPTDLGQMYTDAQDFLQSVKQYHVRGSVLSDQVTQLLNSLSLPLTGDIASNLYAGLEKATNNFQVEVTPEIFDSAALLLRKGAHRQETANITEFPSGSIPTPDGQPDPAWYEPKVYKGTNVS